MRLWRLCPADHAALDGAGPLERGARYSSPGQPVVNFASDAALAVLIGARYLPEARADWPTDLVLGWTEIAAEVESIPDLASDGAIQNWVDEWLGSGRSLLASIPSRVLPEGSIVMMNPRHAAAAQVPPLTARPFDYKDCLHRPPMLETYRNTP